MDLNSVSIFVRVARLGSFTKAARELGLPNSTVSDRISDLEATLGVRLLARTTRRLHLTDSGAIFLGKAEQAIAALIGAGEEASSHQQQPTGVLKITAPAEFDLSSISDVLVAYSEQFAGVEVHVILTDRIVDLLGEGVDIAIRPGCAKYAGLSSTLLGVSGFVLVASPDYLHRSPRIHRPNDLASHKCLVISPERAASGATTWNLTASGDREAKIEPPARILSNSISAIKHLVSIGEGIALLPPLLIHADIAKGRMVHVLPEWSTAPQPIHLVHAARRHASPKVKEMLTLLEPRLREIAWRAIA